MDVEVVAAGVAANELRDDGDEGGEEDDGGAGEAAPLRLLAGLIPALRVPQGLPVIFGYRHD